MNDKQVSFERYDDMLGAVPPRRHTGNGFLVGEAYSFRECSVSGKVSDTFMAFKQRDGKAYEASTALTVAEFEIWRNARPRE